MRSQAICLAPQPVGGLHLREIDIEAPKSGEVLIEVAAVGLNRADLLQRKGLYPPPKDTRDDILGLEFSGTVVGLGRGVTAWSKGDAVMGIVSGGAMSQYLCVDSRHLMAVPAQLDLIAAAALPEACLAAFDALVLQSNLQIGHTVLIHAIGSGIGTIAMQLTHAWGCHVIGTSRSHSKLGRAGALGSFQSVCVQDNRFASAVLGCTNGKGCDVILDTVGLPYASDNEQVIAEGGAWVVFGLMGGAGRFSLDLGQLLARRIRLIGTTLRSRTAKQKADLIKAFRRQAFRFIVEGKIIPVIEDVLPMFQATDALDRLAKNDTFGKLILRW